MKQHYIQLMNQITQALSKNHDEIYMQLSRKDASELIEELNIYHTELEAQHHELREKIEILERQNRRYESLFHKNPSLIIILDKKYIILDRNEKAAGTQNTYLNLGMYFPVSLTKDSARLFIDFIAKLKSEGYAQAEFQIKDSRASVMNVLAEGALLDGAKEGYQLVLQDITEFKKMQNHLHNLIDSKTQEMREKDKIMLAQSRHAAMGELIGIIAHQWKQPLQSLALTAFNLKVESQKTEPEPEELDCLTDEMQTLIQELSRVIDTFRNFLKPDLILKHTPLLDLLTQSQSFLQYSLKQIEMQIEYDVPKDIHVTCNPNTLIQVFINIIKNSYDEYLEKKIRQGKLTITAQEDGTMVKITFQDYAGGVPDEILPVIFDPYVSSKSQNETGIGLYVCKMIVEEKMRGDLRVQNINGGACFTVDLPLIPQELPPSQ